MIQTLSYYFATAKQNPFKSTRDKAMGVRHHTAKRKNNNFYFILYTAAQSCLM
jgi:hypothetical protein